MSIELLYPFTTPANYTFDSDVIEVSGGKAKLKDQRPEDATFHANYNADVDGNWGDGVLTGTPVGGAGVSGGKLDLDGGTLKYVTYDADLNADSQQVGAIRFKVTPNYSGAPSSDRTFFSIFKSSGNSDNLLQLLQLNTGSLYLQINDASDQRVVSGSFGDWFPVADQEYELELNYDLTNGAYRLFVDGVLLSTIVGSTETRDSNIGKFLVGTDGSETVAPDFKIDDVVVFNAVQHTANYTPGASIPATIYATTNPSLICNATFRHEGIDAFTETKTATGSDEAKYILKKGTVKYYWTGSAWAVSDGTYAQSNTAAEIEANKATFTDTAVTTEVTVLIHSDDGSTTPELDVLQVDYNFSGSNPDSIETCIVWGYQVQTDAEADPADIAIHLVNDAVQYKTTTTIMREDYTVTPDENGYWEIELVESENMEGTQNYAFEIGAERFEREVPNELSANFYELT